MSFTSGTGRGPASPGRDPADSTAAPHGQLRSRCNLTFVSSALEHQFKAWMAETLFLKNVSDVRPAAFFARQHAATPPVVGG